MPRPPGRFLPILAAVVLVVLLGAGIAKRLDQPPVEAVAPTGDPAVAVIDGDTLQLGGTVAQIYGIDAPELGQRCLYDDRWHACGQDAAFELRQLIQKEHAPVTCEAPPGTSAPAGNLRVCRAGAVDVAAFLLKSGYAVAAPDTTEGYRDAEESAKQATLGLWHSRFVTPAEWRDGLRLPEEARAEQANGGNCPVKAVVTAEGARVYLVPTDEGYDEAAAAESFCSDEEAREAGWRRPGEADQDATGDDMPANVTARLR